MAVILNIETSNTACSVALTAEGMILHHLENMEGRNHAATLSDFVKAMLDFAASKEINIEAVAVSLGPGSYTGLRIGLSEAKGLAYGLNIPLIGIDTLEIMTTAVMFSNVDIDSETLFIPMLDARRMEVYTAVYDMALTPLLSPQPLILTEGGNPYGGYTTTGRTLLFFGNGMPKWRDYLAETGTFATMPEDKIKFIDRIEPMAVDMPALAERAYVRRDFLDLAYSTPSYLKDFQTTKPRSRV